VQHLTALAGVAVLLSCAHRTSVSSGHERDRFVILQPDEHSQCARDSTELYDRPFLLSRFAVDLGSRTAVSFMDDWMSDGVLAFLEDGARGCRTDPCQMNGDRIEVSNVSIVLDDTGGAIASVSTRCEVRFRYEVVASRQDVGEPLSSCEEWGGSGAQD
jgi:hypothetical protein